MLKWLFRAVAHKKFEVLYEEFPPILPTLIPVRDIASDLHMNGVFGLWAHDCM